MSKFCPVSRFPLSGVMRLVSLARSQVWIGSRCVIALTLSRTGHWKFNMAPHDEEFSEVLKRKRMVALHNDDLGYKNIANSLKLSCGRTGLINSTGAKRHIQRFLFKNIEAGISALSMLVLCFYSGCSVFPTQSESTHYTVNWLVTLNWHRRLVFSYEAMTL